MKSLRGRLAAALIIALMAAGCGQAVPTATSRPTPSFSSVLQPLVRYLLERTVACDPTASAAGNEVIVCQERLDPSQPPQVLHTVIVTAAGGKVVELKSSLDLNHTGLSLDSLASPWFGEALGEAPVGLPSGYAQWIDAHPTGGVGTVENAAITYAVLADRATVTIELR